MRSTLYQSNYSFQMMNDNHPIKIGLSDKKNEFLLNRVLLGCMLFVSIILSSIFFGKLIATILFSSFVFAYIGYKYSSKSFSTIDEGYYNIDNHIDFNDISLIEESDEAKQSRKFDPSYDLSTEYTLYNL